MAGGLAGMATVALTYPFSTVSTRLQVQQKAAFRQQQQQQQGGPQQNLPVPYKGTLDAFKRIIEEEHWTSLYNGLKSAIVGIGCSSFVYYYWYSLLKSISLKAQNKQELGTIENLFIAALSGCANVATTLPIWVVNTRLQLKSNANNKKGIVEMFRTIIRDEGVKGLYNGLIPALILVSNPSVQYVSYEKLKSLWKREGHRNKLTSVEIFMLGALAKLIAGVVTYPYLLVKSRLQATASSESPYKGTWDAIVKIFKADGFLGFFKGMPSKMVQTVLGAAFMFLVKEKIVYYTVFCLFYLKSRMLGQRRVKI
ncbi:hypothetical protein SAMD00019534_094570 [Acytostelium subglobosum LB1]|uniref:hypothetical protein n=1 Tax=Acytostelium subglobosum LB1 TaxID=1410327 RepID=UPI0006448E20|nr:hypothetical protein SAMD00019534_094570 [Acytostelium subglobosum LB1]GAM26282.1 hypothetical protein SAMD00019534_094570 [Acytostelium subglobosum LB1]|eukprot:XP_012750836.1 hypothetical protein SAMD00019534_094570 [Acytostelium subglobosum LB1]